MPGDTAVEVRITSEMKRQETDELSLEQRVASLRPGATKDLAEELLDELDDWRRLAGMFEQRAIAAESWRKGVENAWKAAEVNRA